MSDAERKQDGMTDIFTTLSSVLEAEATPLTTASGSAGGATDTSTESDADRLARLKREVAKGYMLPLGEVQWLVQYADRLEAEAWQARQILARG